MKIKITEPKDVLNVENVELATPLGEDLEDAFRVGQTANGITLTLILLSKIGTFDGKKLPPEDLKRLPMGNLVELVDTMMDKGFLPAGAFGSSLSKLPDQGKDSNAKRN